nr:MAG TPA: hypothetical protein [Caudoviricetes sp.]
MNCKRENCNMLQKSLVKIKSRICFKGGLL